MWDKPGRTTIRSLAYAFGDSLLGVGSSSYSSKWMIIWNMIQGKLRIWVGVKFGNGMSLCDDARERCDNKRGEWNAKRGMEALEQFQPTEIVRGAILHADGIFEAVTELWSQLKRVAKMVGPELEEVWRPVVVVWILFGKRNDRISQPLSFLWCGMWKARIMNWSRAEIRVSRRMDCEMRRQCNRSLLMTSMTVLMPSYWLI